MSNGKGPEFSPHGWAKEWKSEIDKFDILINSKKLKKRTFFQKHGVLLVKYVFDDEDYVIVPMDLIEKRNDIKDEEST